MPSLQPLLRSTGLGLWRRMLCSIWTITAASLLARYFVNLVEHARAAVDEYHLSCETRDAWSTLPRTLQQARAQVCCTLNVVDVRSLTANHIRLLVCIEPGSGPSRTSTVLTD